MVDFKKLLKAGPRKPEPHKVKIKATRGDCMTGKETVVEVELFLTPAKPDGVIKSPGIQMLGGPTGYESFYISKAVIEDCERRGWSACAGTKGRWDSLFVETAECRRAFRLLKVYELI